MSRAIVVSIILGASLVQVIGCNRGVEIHSDDQAVLDKLVSYELTHKIDNNGYVVEVKLEGSQVSDEAVTHVKKLMDLRSLSLYRSSVTDKGIEHLLSMEKLESLGIAGTRVTDKGLASLRKIRTLRNLWLSEKSFSRLAIINLKKANPNLTVHFQ